MKLTEWEGKELLRSGGIPVPRGVRIYREQSTETGLAFPLVLKSQVRTSDRKKKGGILRVTSPEELQEGVERLFALSLDGALPEYLLAEECIVAEKEWYVSFSYSSEFRSPVLALSANGGSGIQNATLIPIDPLLGYAVAGVRTALASVQIDAPSAVYETLERLGKLFETEKLCLAEINPLFVLRDGTVVAGDAKIVRDDALFPPREKDILSLGGDIAVLASGGGASMLDIDLLMRAGGHPANYVEYSGNPPASVVEELTVRVLGQPKVRGAWVVGGTANFTDIYETMMGFVAGVRRLTPKPTYPIVVRRDGPRLDEARAMLQRVAQEEGLALYVCGPETSMAESAQLLLSKMSLV